MWCEQAGDKPDTYAAFRGRLDVQGKTRVRVETIGSAWFVVWLDGAWLGEGPDRFPLGHEEYQVFEADLDPGRHVLAVQAHHIGVTTRILQAMPPFFVCRVVDETGSEVPVDWRCAPLAGYEPQVRRINPQLGWIEWCDTRGNPAAWQEPPFDDAAWPAPVAAGPDLAELPQSPIAPCLQIVHPLQAAAQGPLANWYGYERDDIPVRFYLRDLACSQVPPQGEWRRYDLGRVRLGRPRFTLDLPSGAIVEFAYAEELIQDRVSPFINLSAGPSCNFDHYVARGGRQTFEPLTPKGGRFMEVHVLADPGSIRFESEAYLERSYHGPAEGAFECNDAFLNRAWEVGVETYRACTEDACIDNPTRERGQWTGDVVSVGLYIARAAYSDVRLFRRALLQSALCARDDGLVSGMSPGGDIYLSPYSAQWFDACLRYYRFTGDRSVLSDLHGMAVRNFEAFEAATGADGLSRDLAWPFVDWGYDRGDAPFDVALNLHYLLGVRALSEWSRLVGDSATSARCDERADHLVALMVGWFGEVFAGKDPWPRLGYHASTLALAAGFFSDDRKAECLAYMKRHMMDCFPNNPDAPRLSDPSVENPRIITPYFAHYAFPPLIEHGEMDFVLDQYRTCWGWALGNGRTTWLEVFDPRWSHCHQWAGCPTWQLTRYVLGLWPRYDLGQDHYELHFEPGSLERARGRLPLAAGTGIDIAWEGSGDAVRYRVTPDTPIVVHRRGQPDAEVVEGLSEWTLPRPRRKA